MSVFDSRSQLAKDIPLRSNKNSHNNEMGDWNNFQIILLESAKAKKVVYKKRSFGTWSQFKPVYQSRQQIIRAYCPNIYTVITRLFETRINPTYFSTTLPL